MLNFVKTNASLFETGYTHHITGLDNGIWSYHSFLPIYATLHISLWINLIWGMQLLL